MKTPSFLQLCGAAAVALLPLSISSAQTADASASAKKTASIEERLATMKTNLSLSDDQVAKLKAIFEDQKAAAAPILADKSLSKEERAAKLKPIKDATKAKVKAVLTPEQQLKMKASRKDKKGN